MLSTACWRLAPAIMSAALALSVTACSFQPSPTADSGGGCGNSVASAGRTPVVAVLAQAGPITAGLNSSRAAAYRTVACGATNLGARLLVDQVANANSGANLADATMVAEGANDLFRQQDLAAKQAKLASALVRLGAAPRNRKLDVISALAALDNQLQTVQHGPVYVATIGSLVTSSPLPGGASLDTAHPAAAINALARAGLNFRCDGWRVVAVDPGYLPDGQPLTATQDAADERLWAAYFHHCGGALVAWTNSLLTFPVSGELSGPDMSLMAVQAGPRAVRVTLHSDLTFALNSAALRPGAAAKLQVLVPIIDAARGRITVTGYTDSTGTPAINAPLSRARAVTIARWQSRRTPACPPLKSAPPVAVTSTPSQRTPPLSAALRTGGW